MLLFVLGAPVCMFALGSAPQALCSVCGYRSGCVTVMLGGVLALSRVGASAAVHHCRARGASAVGLGSDRIGCKALCLSLGLQYMLGHDSCCSCYCHAHRPVEVGCLFMLFVFMPHRRVSSLLCSLACSVECGRCWLGQRGWPSPCYLCTLVLY